MLIKEPNALSRILCRRMQPITQFYARRYFSELI